MKTIGIIPARGGSTRLPGKNMRKICGHPLVYWTIQAALKSDLDKVIVSSNDWELLRYVKSLGAEKESTQEAKKPGNRLFFHIRPEFLSRDNSPVFNTITVIAENCRNFSYERYMLLNPTSPCRTERHINDVLKSKSHSVISVYEDPGYWWKDKRRLYSIPRTRTQDAKGSYIENGAIFLMDRYILAQGEIVSKNGRQTELYVMPKQNSIDIDTIFDFRSAEAVLKELIK